MKVKRLSNKIASCLLLVTGAGVATAVQDFFPHLEQQMTAGDTFGHFALTITTACRLQDKAVPCGRGVNMNQSTAGTGAASIAAAGHVVADGDSGRERRELCWNAR